MRAILSSPEIVLLLHAVLGEERTVQALDCHLGSTSKSKLDQIRPHAAVGGNILNGGNEEVLRHKEDSMPSIGLHRRMKPHL